MGASITLAGESLIAQKQGAGEKLEVARFVLALVPGLDPNAPVDRTAGKPPASQIVFTKAYDRKGYVSPNQVIYSLMVGSDVGDWDFNWIGLEASEGVLLAVATVPVQQKRKNIPPLQIGNNVTRNFLVEFNGAQALTGITVDASTWQHDFTIRLNGIDLRERMSNRDVFGRVCYLADSLQMERSFDLYQVKAGIAYVEGIRVELAEPVQVQLPALPVKAWLDVALAREGSDAVAAWKVVFGAAKTDYVDSNGTAHYLVELAQVSVSEDIVDLRQSEPITGALVKQFALRNGDYEHLRARATTKDDVDLGELPNAKSDDPGTDSSEILATTKALNALRKVIADSEVGRIGTFAMATPPPGWFRANGAAVSRTVYAALFAKIGTTYGAGDGVNTFNLPDPRGKFIRVLDDGRGIDAGRVLGSSQADEVRNHNHTGSASAAGAHNHTASSDAQGSHSHQVKEGSAVPSMPGGEILASGDDVTQAAGSYSTTSADGLHAHNISVNAVAAHSHVITVGYSGGAETRPQNIAFLACIKY
ncbi:phage tail protein [Pseudomonas mandelii]|uniref:phage tail-collar fiber domain-containing protein n=1 Tax=Pseudomonas mandelii TaxID=75612 RepID=UPI001C83D268|nr:phage tail protein [Pseudomonas mandelii]QZA96403.1 phage tail protein [Pseudomonas mandelii]